MDGGFHAVPRYKKERKQMVFQMASDSDEDMPLKTPRRHRAIVIDLDDDDSDTPLSPIRPMVTNIPKASSPTVAQPAAVAKSSQATTAKAPVKKPAKAKAPPKAKTHKDPNSVRKGGKWTACEDEELLELIVRHGDGTPSCWSTIAELHSRSTSANALKTRFKELPDTAKSVGELWINMRIQFRNALLPLVVDRYRARQRAWLKCWAGVVRGIHADAAVVLQAAWHVALDRRRRAARHAAELRRLAIRRATEQLRCPATRWLRRVRSRITLRRVAERRFRVIAAAWFCRLRQAARLVQQHVRRRAQARMAKRAAAATRLVRAWRSLITRRASEERSAMVSDTSYKAKLNEYMSHLKAAVDERRFDLSECSGESSVNTSRLIKPMHGWEGMWPALRELMQNTIDHLKLLGDEGTLNSVLRIEHEVRRKEPLVASAAPSDTQRQGTHGKAAPGKGGKGGGKGGGGKGGGKGGGGKGGGKGGGGKGGGKGGGGEEEVTHEFRFVCVRPACDEVVCAITVDKNALVIEQAHTFPLHPRALDTGVVDESKQNTGAAGGFGDGFKTAAIAILAKGGAMDWRFEAEGNCIRWVFEGEARRAVGVISAGKVLNVRILARPLMTAWPGPLAGTSHRMIQCLRLPGVGDAFRSIVMRRLQVFWTIDRSLMLSPWGTAARPKQTNRKLVRSHAFLADATRLPPIEGAIEPGFSVPHRPEPGVYVRGIWVEASPIFGTVVSFDVQSGVSVSGRDRNSVSDEDKQAGVMHILRTCDNSDEHRYKLLKPLMGVDAAPSQQGEEEEEAKDAEKCDEESWLLRSPDWLGMLLTRYRGEFLAWLRVPQDAIFVTCTDDHSQGIFMRFAMRYLQKTDAPIVKIRMRANPILFTEAKDVDVRLLLIEHLLRDQGPAYLQRGSFDYSCRHRKSGAAELTNSDYERGDCVRLLLQYAQLETTFTLHILPSVPVDFAHRDWADQHGNILGGRRVGGHLFVAAGRPLTKARLSDMVGKMSKFTTQRLKGSYELLSYLMQALGGEAAFQEKDKDVTIEDVRAIITLADRFKRRAQGNSSPPRPEPVALMEEPKPAERSALPEPLAQTEPPKPAVKEDKEPAPTPGRETEVVNLISDDESDEEEAPPSPPPPPAERNTTTTTTTTTAGGGVEQQPVPACAQAPSMDPPEKIDQAAYGGHEAQEREEEHEMAGDLLWRKVLDHHGRERELYVGEHDLASLDEVKEQWTVMYERFERALAEVVARTNSTLPVFAAFAPSETGWRGMNFGRRYAVINIGHARTAKAYKWTIVHELAHQKGSEHDREFCREFQVIAELVDPSDE